MVSPITESEGLADKWVASRRQLEAIKDVDTLVKFLNRKSSSKASAESNLEELIDEPLLAGILDGNVDLIRARIEIPKERNIYGERGVSSKFKTVTKSILFSVERRRSTPVASESSTTWNSELLREKRSAILNIIADGISPSEFNSFARCLEVFSESEIREIESRNHHYRTRTLVLLDEFEVRRKPLKNVLLALLKMPRTDLAQKVKRELNK